MTFIYLLCGVPGSGKSSWIKAKQISGDVVVSRDQIRFAMLKDSDNYFDKEKAVFGTFINDINMAITNKAKTIFVDATHLNERARNKVLDKLWLNDETKVIPVYFDIPLEVALENNAKRNGRARVPEDRIRDMFRSMKAPHFNEKHEYACIYYVGQNSTVKVSDGTHLEDWKINVFDPPGEEWCGFTVKDTSLNAYPLRDYKIDLKGMFKE